MYSKRVTKTNAHLDAIYSVSWIESGNIITGSIDETVKVWNSTHIAGQGGHEKDNLVEAQCIDGHELGVLSSKVHKNCKHMAVSSLDCKIRLYDLATDTLDKTLDLGPVESWMIGFHPKEPILATGGQNGKVQVWHYEKSSQPEAVSVGESDFFLSVEFSDDGTHFAAGSESGSLVLLDSSSNRVVHTFQHHRMPVRSVAYCMDGNLVVAASDDNNISLCDPRQAGAVTYLAGHTAWVLSVKADNHGKSLASGSADKLVNIWDIGKRKCLHTFRDHSEPVWDVAFSPDGRHLVSVGDDANLHMYQLRD